jgi:hypothetical protein
MSTYALQSLTHTLLQDEYQDLYYCVTCGARGVVLEMSHEPKKQYRKELGVLCDLPFLCVFPQCSEHHDHTMSADEFDAGCNFYQGSSFDMFIRRHELQRRFVEIVRTRREYKQVCRGYH